MDTQPIVAHLLSQVIDRLGQDAWSRFDEAERSLVAACCTDAAALQLVLLQTPEPSIAETARRERAHIVSQLANLTAARGVAIEAAIWEVASRLLVRAGTAILQP